MDMFTDRKALTTALGEFYETVATRIEYIQKQRKNAHLYEATGFTAFDYIHPDENRLSDVICDLLDPSGKHGQGTLFLNSFLEVVGVPPETIYTRVRAKREDRTSYCSSSERRIDITLDFGDFGIGIENKPFAFEAENQLTDYSLHLRGKYKRFLLVYLSGDGREPT